MRKEFFDASEFSLNRRVAIQSIKEKLDDQAKILNEEEKELKDKCDYYRRKEDMLRTLKQKLEMYENDQTSDTLLKEIQIDYNKFLKLYLNDLDTQLLNLPNKREKRKSLQNKKREVLAF